jgi:hypothetical protein
MELPANKWKTTQQQQRLQTKTNTDSRCVALSSTYSKTVSILYNCVQFGLDVYFSYHALFEYASCLLLCPSVTLACDEPHSDVGNSSKGCSTKLNKTVPSHLKHCACYLQCILTHAVYCSNCLLPEVNCKLSPLLSSITLTEHDTHSTDFEWAVWYC